MPERSYAISDYRYGYNCKEKEKEVVDGFIAFEARIFDSRICRFLSRDPMESKYSWQTPYSYCYNSPISRLDFLGMSGDDPKGTVNRGVDGNNIYLPHGATATYYDTDGNGYKKGDLKSFTIGDKSYSARFSEALGFQGYTYFDGVSKFVPYENMPEVSYSGGYNPRDGSIKIDFTVDNYNNGGPLRLIQLDYGTPVIPGTAPWNQYSLLQPNGYLPNQYLYNGNSRYGEVDGGANSYAAMQWGFFYASTGKLISSRGSELLPELQSKFAGCWTESEYITPYYTQSNSNSMSEIGYYDNATIRTCQQTIQFTTILVAQNYMNSGVDAVLAVFTWGYTDRGTVQLPIEFTNKLTPLDKSIFEHYYPNSQYKVGDTKMTLK